MLATVRLFARPDQWEPRFEQTARKNWFWGNALNPLDDRTIVRQYDHWFEFSGKKSFCSGALDSEMLIASGLEEHSRKLLIAAVPTARAGITINGDWNCFGQRQTDSGSALFEGAGRSSELLREPGPLSTPFSALRPLLAQLMFVHLFLGLGEGALAEARRYTLHEARPWYRSPAEHASGIPTRWPTTASSTSPLRARLLARHAAALFDEAWRHGETLDATGRAAWRWRWPPPGGIDPRRLGRGEPPVRDHRCAATHGALRLDRFWRNLRVQTLHDPVDYKAARAGRLALNGELPAPSFYS